MDTETTTVEFTRHAKTGLPVQNTPTFAVGDLVTESFGSDSYPAVVVYITPKTVYVSPVRYVVNAQPEDVPGYNGYGDSATLVIDPESIEEAKRAGKTGARKYSLRTWAKPSRTSLREEREYGSPRIHRSRWTRPGGYGSLSAGARFRQDPHF